MQAKVPSVGWLAYHCTTTYSSPGQHFLRQKLTSVDVAAVREPSSERNGRHLEARLAEEAVLHGRKIVRLGHCGGSSCMCNWIQLEKAIGRKKGSGGIYLWYIRVASVRKLREDVGRLYSLAALEAAKR